MTGQINHADEFFRLVQGTVNQATDAAARQFEVASNAVIAASAAETHARAAVLVSQTFMDAGGKMLAALEDLRAQMAAKPLAKVMFRSAYLVIARSVLELAARANGTTPEAMAEELAPELGASARELLAINLPADTRRQLDQITATALIEHKPAEAPTPTSSRRDRARDDAGRFATAGTA